MTPPAQPDPYRTQMDILVDWKREFIKLHGYYPNINDVWNKIDDLRGAEKSIRAGEISNICKLCRLRDECITEHDTRRSRPVAASQPTPEIRSMREDEDGHISWQRMNERTLADHEAAIRNEVLDEVYNKIDGKRVCKWGESERCEVLDLVESFRTTGTADKGGE